MTQAPFDTLRRVSRALMEADAIPLLGSLPPFPWEAITDELKSRLNLGQLSLSSDTPKWQDGGDATSGLGQNLMQLSITCPPLEGQAVWVMGQKDVEGAMTTLLGGTDYAAALGDTDLRTALFQFLSLEVMRTCRVANFPPNLSPRVAQTDPNLNGPVLTIDVTATTGKTIIAGRLILTTDLLNAWRSHFTRPSPVDLTTPVAKETTLSLRLNAGSVALSRTEWNQIACGDFVTLDKCTIDPDTGFGSALITLQQRPLFTAHVSSEGATLQQPVETDEELRTMSDDEFDEELPSFEEAEDDEFEEEVEETPPQEEVEEPVGEEVTPLPEPETAAPVEVQVEKADSLVSASDVPVTIAVEVGRLRMSAEKLLALQPGNMLDLGLGLEQGVDLTVNGQCVGRGELIRIGDVVGVRLTELG